MAGDKLPLTNDPLPNIQTNKAGFGTDLTVGDKYENLINIKGAKFLDLYRGSIKIDDADDLKEALKSYDVEMSIAFNDNPDNDEFRKAYIVVITNLTEKDATDDPAKPSTGTIKLVGDAAKKADVVDGSITVLESNGKATATFSIVKPEWADNANPASELTIKYNIYCNGKLWDNNKTLTSGAYSATPSATDLLADNATPSKITKYTVTGLVLDTNKDLIGQEVTVEITDVTWKNIYIKYQDADGNALVGAPTTDKVTTANGGSINADAAVDTNKYTKAGAKMTITGAVKDTGNAAITDEALADLTTNVHAIGDGYVIVKISGLTTGKKLDVTTPVYSTADGKTMLGGTDTTVGEILTAKDVGTAAQKAFADTVQVDILAKSEGDSNPTLVAGAQGYGQLTQGNSYAAKVTIANVDGTGAYKVTLTAKVDGKVVETVTKMIVATAGGNFATEPFKATGNVEVDVDIEPVAAPKIENVKYVGNDEGGILTFDVTAPLDIEAGYSATTWLELNAATTKVAINRDADKPFVIEVDEANEVSHVTISLTEATAGTTFATGNIEFKAAAKTTKDFGAIALTGQGVTLTVSTPNVTPSVIP